MSGADTAGCPRWADPARRSATRRGNGPGTTTGTGSAEVHVNTLEGLWTGLRNFLRPFRGVSKVYLYQYVAMFEWGYNVKRVTEAFVCALLGVRSATICPT